MLRNNNSFCKQPRMLMTNRLKMNACCQQKLAHFSPYKDKEKKVSSALVIYQFFNEGLY